MSQPFFTVAIPTHNRADYLRGCIENLLRQTCGDFELVVSDNCSTDATPEVVRSFTDPRIRYVRHETNLGAWGNFNYVADHATGRYVVIHQDDDRLTRTFLQRCRDAVEADPAVTLFASAVWKGNADDGFAGTLMTDLEHHRMDHLLEDRPMVMDGRLAATAMLVRLDYVHPAVALQTQALRDVGGYEVTDDRANDVIIQARVACRGKVGYDPRPGAFMLTHVDTYYRYTLSRKSRHLYARNMYITMIDDFQKAGVDWAAILNGQLAHASVGELLRLIRVWVRYGAPPHLQKLGMDALSRKTGRGGVRLAGFLARKLGVSKSLKYWRGQMWA